jgi:pilus assembly protein Flp/PilA
MTDAPFCPVLGHFLHAGPSGSAPIENHHQIQREGNILMLEFFRNITSRRNEDGASAVEYGLLVAGIAALIVAVVFVFGGVIKDAFKGTCNTVASHNTASGGATSC